jgi:hypothetical protein
MRLTLFLGVSALNFSNTLPKLEMVASTNFTVIFSFSVSQNIRSLIFFVGLKIKDSGRTVGRHFYRIAMLCPHSLRQLLI